MVWFLNLIYYFHFRLEYRFEQYLDKSLIIFRPLAWLFEQIPFVRQRFIRQYGSLENTRAAMKDFREKKLSSKLKEYNTSRIAVVMYSGTLIFFFWGTYFLACHYAGQSLMSSRSSLIVGGIISLSLNFLVTYLASDRKQRYRHYFKQFDKITGTKRLLYIVVALAIPLASFTFWLWAMGFMHS